LVRTGDLSVFIKLSADRLKSELTNVASRSLVHVDPEVMDKHGLKVGDVIQIGTGSSKYPVPARIGECFEDDRGSGVIRLDRFLRTATKAKINEEVEIRALGAVPELESVTLMPPIDVSTAHHLIEHLQESFIENKTPAGVAPPQQEFRYVSPDFFETIGARLVAGRDFNWTDHHERRRVAMVSERMARREWGSASAAVGGRIRMTPAQPWREIVGVVGDIHHESLVEPPPDSVYLTLGDPLAQYMSRTVTFVIRSSRVGTRGFLEELQKSVWSVDGALPLANIQTMEDYYERAMEPTALTLLLLGLTAGMALLLGLVGIYGVISYIVSLRVREIGIRLALGAQIGVLRRMLLGRVVALVLVGLALGLAGAAMLASLMESLVFGVTPHDPVTYAQVSAILGLTAICAGYLPARRITRIDPASALRAE